MAAGDGRDDAVRRAGRIAQRLAALPEPEMRRAVLAELVGAGEPRDHGPVLAHIVSRGRRGGPPFDLALLALGALLADPAALPYERRAALYEAARAAGHLDLADLFLSPATTAAVAPPPPLNLGGRAVTLGERKAFARGRRRDLLDHLMRDPDAAVIRILLGNPRLCEADVVTIAARRPQLALVQREIARARRWIGRYSVKLALVLNPNTPTDVAVRLLGFLAAADLRQVTADAGLNELVRAAARRRLAGGGAP